MPPLPDGDSRGGLGIHLAPRGSLVLQVPHVRPALLVQRWPAQSGQNQGRTLEISEGPSDLPALRRRVQRHRLPGESKLAVSAMPEAISKRERTRRAHHPGPPGRDGGLGASAHVSKSLPALRTPPASIPRGADGAALDVAMRAGQTVLLKSPKSSLDFDRIGPAIVGPVAPAARGALEVPMIPAAQGVCRAHHVNLRPAMEASRPFKGQDGRGAGLAGD